MGKAKKVKVSKGETKQQKVPLAEQIEDEKTLKSKNRNKIKIRTDEDEEVTFHNLIKFSGKYKHIIH